MKKSKLQFKIKTFISKNEDETLNFAENFAKQFRGGEVIALVGDLGAGKTVFTRGLARGLGIKQKIQSPTFLLMKIYKVRKSESQKVREIKFLVHVDAYRLGNASELENIGILDWLGRADTVTVIEWADKVLEIFRGKKVIKIKMELGKKEEERKVTINK